MIDTALTWAICVLVGLVVLMVGAFLWVGYNQAEDFKNHCRTDLAGHITTVHNYKSTTYFCLSGTGSVLDVY